MVAAAWHVMLPSDGNGMHWEGMLNSFIWYPSNFFQTFLLLEVFSA
jgi:hypothetical protein